MEEGQGKEILQRPRSTRILERERERERESERVLLSYWLVMYWPTEVWRDRER
jgi:hypothetical protein